MRQAMSAALTCVVLLAVALPVVAQGRPLEAFIRVLPDTGGRGFEFRLRNVTEQNPAQALADQNAATWCADYFGPDTYEWTGEPLIRSDGKWWDRSGLCLE
ncbi:hypothetical protein [Roseisalinus antarcticus]|uniref:Uncharacterized protein n=1 Tax=Roseisalinus antarcticus TaxID=254357 RepID=A0A1Y5SJ19_9RHOB|nr:hypothetical protein [Roseisalinus antarcticus]SLN41281.1 hypothetical protein ROA7023_01645 [Roseisalinus antarcticus]